MPDKAYQAENARQLVPEREYQTYKIRKKVLDRKSHQTEIARQRATDRECRKESA